jgi:hypothetical protein
MIDPVLPAGVMQALTGKAERPPVPIMVVSLPKALTGTPQPREIGGTVTQAAADGNAVLHTASGDISIKAPVVLAPGRIATLLLTPTSAGFAAALHVSGPAPPLVQAQGLSTASAAPANSTAAPAATAVASGQAAAAPLRAGRPLPQAGDGSILGQSSLRPDPAHNAPGLQPTGPRPAPPIVPETLNRGAAVQSPTGFTPASMPAPHPQSHPGLRDAALLLNQLATQLTNQPLSPMPSALTPPAVTDVDVPPLPMTTAAAAPVVIPNSDDRPLPADPASLLIGLAAGLRRPPARVEESGRDLEARDDGGTPPGESVYRSTGKQPEQSENISWRQFHVMDESRIVPVFLGRHPQEQDEETQTAKPAGREQPARFTVRFDLDHAGAVRIDSVYRDRRLDTLLTLDRTPDPEMQTAVRERLSVLSDEFGLSISLRISEPEPAAG